jgi:predicted DNA-binding helix-hairpin-helix protein
MSSANYIHLHALPFSEHTSVEVVNHFLDIMSSCLEESEDISLELLEKILANLLPEQKVRACGHGFPTPDNDRRG